MLLLLKLTYIRAVQFKVTMENSFSQIVSHTVLAKKSIM